MPRFRGALRPIRFMLGAHSAYYIIFKTENQKSLILRANENVNLEKGWGFGAFADSDDVLNTSDFQIGFTYNF